VVLCAPPLLLAIWVACLFHNLDRGLMAVRYATALGPPADGPLFLAGSASGLLLAMMLGATGGTEVLSELLSQRWTWALVLMPEIAWAGPLAVAWLLLPLRRPMERLTRPQTTRAGAFEPC